MKRNTAVLLAAFAITTMLVGGMAMLLLVDSTSLLNPTEGGAPITQGLLHTAGQVAGQLEASYQSYVARIQPIGQAIYWQVLLLPRPLRIFGGLWQLVAALLA